MVLCHVKFSNFIIFEEALLTYHLAEKHQKSRFPLDSSASVKHQPCSCPSCILVVACSFLGRTLEATVCKNCFDVCSYCWAGETGTVTLIEERLFAALHWHFYHLKALYINITFSLDKKFLLFLVNNQSSNS